MKDNEDNRNFLELFVAQRIVSSKFFKGKLFFRVRPNSWLAKRFVCNLLVFYIWQIEREREKENT